MIHNLENRAFILLLLTVSLAFIWLMAPFLSAIFWAALLAILFQPLFLRLQRKWPGKDTRNALITLGVSWLGVVIPLTGILILVGFEAFDLYVTVSQNEAPFSQISETLQSHFPAAYQWASDSGWNWERVRILLLDLLQSSSEVLARSALHFGQGYVAFLLNLVLMLYLTFYFLRDGPRLRQLLIRALPLGDQRETRLMQKFAEVSRATVKGSLVVALVQGTLGGIAFAILGIESAILWGTLMVILSLLPAVGSALIWVPAALWLLLQESYFSALFLAFVGFFVIGLVDNILRPLLVGRDTKMPDYLVLLSTLGGIALFGLNGFIMGPVLAALFLVVWQIFMEEYEDSREH